MFDFSAIQPKSLAKIHKISLLDQTDMSEFFGLDPSTGLPTVNEELGTTFDNGGKSPTRIPYVAKIEGEHFENATDVILNGNNLNFQRVSTTVILAVIPDTLIASPTESLFIVTDRPTFSNSSLFSFEFGNNPKQVSGTDKLIAQFIKILLTNPGSDAFSPREGSGIRGMIGSRITSTQSLLAKVSMAVLRTSEQLRSSQRNLNIPNAEKLLNVDIVGMNYSTGAPGEIELRLRINTWQGSAVNLALDLGKEGALADIVAAAAQATTGG